MKKAFIALLAVWLAGCGPPAALKTVDATPELKQLMEKVTAAWETLDPSKVAQYYAKDVGLAFYDVAPLKYSGWEQYENGSKKTFSTWKSVKVAISPDFNGYKNGNIAWATFTSSFEITPEKGPVMKGTTRNTELLEKRGEAWIIIHEHVSAPMLETPAPAPTPVKAKAKTKAKAKKKKR